MKRKVAMLGLAVMTGMPQFAFATGLGKSSASKASPSVDNLQLPQYEAEGSVYRLMGRLSTPETLPLRKTVNAWQMEFVPPPLANQADGPLMSKKDKRLGVTFKLDF